MLFRATESDIAHAVLRAECTMWFKHLALSTSLYSVFTGHSKVLCPRERIQTVGATSCLPALHCSGQGNHNSSLKNECAHRIKLAHKNIMPFPIKHDILVPLLFNPTANHSKLKYIFYKIKRKKKFSAFLFKRKLFLHNWTNSLIFCLVYRNINNLYLFIYYFVNIFFLQ